MKAGEKIHAHSHSGGGAVDKTPLLWRHFCGAKRARVHLHKNFACASRQKALPSQRWRAHKLTHSRAERAYAAAAAPDAMMLFARLPQDTCNINF